jgi:hypothetical protein
MSKGQDCIINRTVPISTKVSIKRSTNASRDLGAREGYWEGLIPYSNSLQSGEYITIDDEKYLVQSANYDHASKETMFFCAKCNSIIQHMRISDSVDSNNNVDNGWATLKADVPCYGEIVTYRLLQADVGLLDSTKYTFHVPKSLGVKLLDRFEFNSENYKVDSIDSLGMSGVVRVQLSADQRV